MSPQSWCCHHSAMVPKGIALPSAAQALGGGGPRGRVASPQLSSARQGPRPSPACGQQAGQHFHLDLVAACLCQGSGETTWRWRVCRQHGSLLRFQVPLAVFQLSIRTPICNSPGSQSIPVCSAWQGQPKLAIKACRTAFPFLPQQRGAED